MKSFDIFEHHTLNLGPHFGSSSSFWIVNIDTIIYTLIVLAILGTLIPLARISLKKPDTVHGYITETFVRMIMQTVTQSLEHFTYRHCAFIGSLFTYIFLCNVVVLLPFMEEPTKDLNTTIALALISFVYVQSEGIRAHGLLGYLKELCKPIFVFFPLEVLGKLATIVSLSFRLFGNIFGGSVIGTMWKQAISGSILTQTIGLLCGINLIIMLFFGVFEGLIQAFVFSILSLTYLSMTIAKHDEHEA